MLRGVNAYDSTNKTQGYFGYFREICSNGLHLGESHIGFSVKHSGNIVEVVIPSINELMVKFVENEYYSIHKKFNVLAETPIKDLTEFVKYTLGKTGLFKYEASEKNPDPSLNSRLVIEIIEHEASTLNVQPNLWLGYNAFNELLHNKLKKSFEVQKQLDIQLFDAVLTMAN